MRLWLKLTAHFRLFPGAHRTLPPFWIAIPTKQNVVIGVTELTLASIQKSPAAITTAMDKKRPYMLIWFEVNPMFDEVGPPVGNVKGEKVPVLQARAACLLPTGPG